MDFFEEFKKITDSYVKEVMGLKKEGGFPIYIDGVVEIKPSVNKDYPIRISAIASGVTRTAEDARNLAEALIKVADYVEGK